MAFRWSVVLLPASTLGARARSPRSYWLPITPQLSGESSCLSVSALHAEICSSLSFRWFVETLPSAVSSMCSYRYPLCLEELWSSTASGYYFLFNLFYNDPWPLRERSRVNMFHLQLDILEFFSLCTLASMCLYVVHCLLQIEVSLMKVKRCINLEL